MKIERIDSSSYADLYHGDALAVMDELAEDGRKFDAIITDPPFGSVKGLGRLGTPDNPRAGGEERYDWDTAIPMDEMMAATSLVARNGAVMCLFCAPPLTYHLGSRASYFSWVRSSRYIWAKGRAGNFLSARKAPVSVVEDILVWRRSDQSQDAKPRQAVFNLPAGKGSKINLLTYRRNVETDRGDHPAQKPVALMADLVMTYTNPGDTVLDFSMGSGSTGVAARMSGRKFVGIEKDERYYQTAVRRIQETPITPYLV